MIQGSINQLLGMAAAGSAYLTKQAAAKYEAQRSAEYDKSYQAQLEAAQKGYTKSGAKSKSKDAISAREAAELATPGAGSKAPWNKETEKRLSAEYNDKIKGLQERTAKGLSKLQEANREAKAGTYKQFGDYESIAPQMLKKMDAKDRWKIQAQQKIEQRKAFDDFVNSLKGGK